MDYLIGDRIKDLRDHLHMSQQELSDGICTQGLISRIEKHTATPTAPLLHQLALRLGVDLNYFFDDISRNGIDYVKETINHIDQLVRHHEYEDVMKTIQLEKTNPLFKKPHLQQYFIWREGICVFHMEKDSKKSLLLLDEALALRPDNQKKMSEMDIDILSSKAIVYSEIGRLDLAADIYTTLLNEIERLPLRREYRLIIRILFNASRNAYDRKNYRESLFYANKGIKTCVNEDQLYLLGHLFYQKGCSLFRLHPAKKQESLQLLYDALWIYQLHPVPKVIQELVEEIEIIKNS
ncbi:helix-turn-helix domain-containing protein [Salipaludibacillus agaradhaerens]|uniref:Helix-turn-helix domain-containing protein n=1 Tax=Salipaludibacillus agaradhaerens TaxID=76935 RepID=A0A9Q4G1D1_SALAG|nr:helix-turn-helix transcriptional regulator [Salipaludibacillus agaradhaerens]MCR6098734.1 helix-turn-helix domain-containing protein [Salipaludibacillus agaradhaerens]MCR6115741.1 helix-turn-helix domain-containing protein [Salipaludibacillus agaradhaerens]